MTAKAIHPISELVKNKALMRLDRAKAEGETYESIAGKAGTVKNHIFDLHKRNKRITLSMAFKIWEGLGGKITELVSGLDPDPFWQRLESMTKDQREVILKLIDLLDSEGKTIGVKSLKDNINNLHAEVFNGESPTPTKTH